MMAKDHAFKSSAERLVHLPKIEYRKIAITVAAPGNGGERTKNQQLQAQSLARLKVNGSPQTVLANPLKVGTQTSPGPLSKCPNVKIMLIRDSEPREENSLWTLPLQ
jgi:hypothetical protein